MGQYMRKDLGFVSRSVHRRVKNNVLNMYELCLLGQNITYTAEPDNDIPIHASNFLNFVLFM